MPDRPKPLDLADQKIIVAAADKWRTSVHDEHIGELFDAVARMVAKAEQTARAEAWDEGYKSGHSRAMRRMSDEPNVPAAANPYRSAP